MYELIITTSFSSWLDELSDERAQVKIALRLDYITLVNLGDWKPVGDGVFEIRVHYGPGYRLYFMRKDRIVIILLAGGDKSSQARDIAAAKQIKRDIEQS